MQLRRMHINGQSFMLTDSDSGEQLRRDIAEAARSGPAWVTIPAYGKSEMQILITPNVDCSFEVMEIPDEDLENEGAAIMHAADWPDYEN